LKFDLVNSGVYFSKKLSAILSVVKLPGKKPKSSTRRQYWIE